MAEPFNALQRDFEAATSRSDQIDYLAPYLPGKPAASVEAKPAGKIEPQQPSETWGQWWERLATGSVKAFENIGGEMQKQGREALGQVGKDITDPNALKERANAIGPGIPGEIPVLMQDLINVPASAVRGFGTAVLGEPAERLTGGRIPKETGGEALEAGLSMLLPTGPAAKGAKALEGEAGAARAAEAPAAAKAGAPEMSPLTGARARLVEAPEGKPVEEVFTYARGKEGAPAAGKPPHEMTLGEIDQAIADASKSEDDKLLEALGTPERVKRFKALERKANSSDPKRSDEGSAQMDAEFGNLDERQQQLVYGIGEPGLSADDLKEVRKAIESVTYLADEDTQEVTRVLTRGMLDIDPEQAQKFFERGDAPAHVQAAVVRIRGALEELAARGASQEEIERATADAMAARGFSQPDALEVLSKWKGALREGAPKLEAPAVEGTAVPGVADERGLPPEGWDNRLDPTTGEPWDPNMDVPARTARVLRAFPGLQQKPLEEAAPGVRQPLPYEIPADVPLDAVRDADKMKSRGLIVARRMPDGTIRYGLPGEIHADLYRVGDPEMTNAQVDASEGFATGLGQPFLTRQEAADLANATVLEKTPDGPQPIKVTPEMRAKLAGFVNGTREAPIEVVIEALGDPETRADVVNQVAKIIPKDGVKPIEVTKQNAYMMQMSPDEVMATLRSQFPDDEHWAAAGAVMNAAAETFYGAAQRAVLSGKEEDWDAAIRAFSILNKYIGDYRAAKTNWGRAGRIQQEVMEAQPAHVTAMQKMIEEAGVKPELDVDALKGAAGSANVEAIIRKAAGLEDPAKVAPWLATLRKMFSRDGMVFGYQNILLSNPKSVAKEILSDMVTASWDVATRWAAELAGGVPRGSARTLAYGYITSFADSLRLAGRALKMGKSQFAPEYQTIDGAFASRMNDLMGGMAKAGETDQPGSAAVRYLRMGVPTNWQMAADDFNKSWHYNAYRRTYAWEQAMAEGGTAEDVTSRFRKLFENTPQEIHEQALAKALKNSFQEPLTPRLQHLADIVDDATWQVPGTSIEIPFGRLIMPFTKVPANIAKWPFANSPAALAMPSFWRDVRAGGSRRALALTRVGMGTGVIGVTWAMASADNLTGYGPRDPDLRSKWLNTHQPYSFRGPDGGWYSYLSFGGASLLIGMAADGFDVYRFQDSGSVADQENLMWSSVFSIGQSMLSPTYMAGMADFFDAVMNPEDNAKYYAENVGASFIPQAVWGIERAMDPTRRAHYDYLDNLQSRTPGLSKDLPPARDWLGDPVRWPQGVMWPITGSPLADAISPLSFKPDERGKNPVNDWIWEHRLDFPRGDMGRIGMAPPGIVQTFQAGQVKFDYRLNAQQIDKLKVLTAQGVKEPIANLSAKDLMNAMVEGKAPAAYQRDWDRSSPESKAVLLQSIWAKFRNAAQKQLLAEDRGLAAIVEQGLKDREKELLAGPGGAGAPAPALVMPAMPPPGTRAPSGPVQQPTFR